MFRIIPIITFCLIGSFSMGQAAQIDLNKPVKIKGKVLDPNGKPTAARIRAFSVKGEAFAETKTTSAGQFEITVSLAEAKEKSGNLNWRAGVIIADSKEFCPSWVSLETALNDKTTTLRLVEDEPIQGTVLDSSGQPVPRAKVEVHTLHRMNNENLDRYLKTYRDRVTTLGNWLNPTNKVIFAPWQTALENNEFTTDDDGSFTLRGIGKERIVQATIKGSTVASQFMTIITRPQIEAKWKRHRLSRFDQRNSDGTVGGARIPVVYAARFEHIGTPATSVSGTVTAKDTGKPLTGVRISAQMKTGHGGRAETDNMGRYEITGLPTQGSVKLYVICPDGMAYVNADRQSADYTATSPIKNTDFELTPGILVRGSLADSDGKPVQGYVDYVCLQDNEYARRMQDSFGQYTRCETDENGDFEVVAIPGRGLITAKAREDKYEKATFEGLGLPLYQDVNHGALGSINKGIIRGERYHAIKVITPKSLKEDVTVHFKLAGGGEGIIGKLVDAKGKPVRKTKWWQPNRNYGDVLESDEFAVQGLQEDEERRIVFRHEKRRLGAVIEVDKKSVTPLNVTLRPYATITGRLVDKAGKPVAGARYAALTLGTSAAMKRREEDGSRPKHEPIVCGQGETDPDGRFRIDDLIPGHKSELAAGRRGDRMPKALKQLALRSGESRDLGDVVLK